MFLSSLNYDRSLISVQPEFWSSHGQTDRQTESDAYWPIVQKHKCAYKPRPYWVPDGPTLWTWHVRSPASSAPITPFLGPPGGPTVLPFGPPVVLPQLPSYCLPTTWCTSLESSLKILDLDPLTYDLWHWTFESLTDSRLEIGIFLHFWPWPMTLTFDLDLCDLDPHNVDLNIEPLILILCQNWHFSHFWPWWPWPSTYDLDQWLASRWKAYGSMQYVLAL